MRERKISYSTNYFQHNLNDLKSTWKGIKNLFSLKELPDVVPPIFSIIIEVLLNHKR